MFFRIYTGIAISIMLALGLVYSVYHVSYQARLEDYGQSILKGSLQLIAEGYQRQQNQNKSRWLHLVQQLSGLELSVRENIQSDKDWSIEADSEAKISARIVFEGLEVAMQPRQINEQQLRAIALLSLNELAVKQGQPAREVISRLDTLYPFSISSQISPTFALDAQQQLRLAKGEVVVALSETTEDYLVYANLPDGQVLSVGPIGQFRVLTIELTVMLVMLSIIVTSAVTYWLVRKLELRLNLINRALSQFGPANLKSRVPENGNDVIARLGVKANQMADRIESLLVHQKEITQAVSHELRTPIARIKFRIQLLSDMLDDTNAEVEAGYFGKKVEGINLDIQQLESLIDEMLALHKLDVDPKAYSTQPVDLALVLKTAFDNYPLLFPALELDCQIEQNAQVIANSSDMNRLFENLIGNACKHANQQVQVSLKVQNAMVLVRVDDDGSGIESSQRKKVFQPFVRLENSEGKPTSGYGLGLAIVGRIARLNNAQVSVSDSPSGGARFELCMPLLAIGQQKGSI